MFQVEIDMKFAFKSIVVAAAFIAAGAANASTTLTAGNSSTSVTVGGQSLYLVSGSGALTFSQTLIDALNTGSVAVEAVAPALSNIVGAAGEYTAVGVAAPVGKVEVGAGGLVETAYSFGGAKQIAGAVKGVSYGGSISVTNLKIDLVNKNIYADFVGAGKNSTGAIVNVNATNVLAWTFSDIAGATNVTGAGTFDTLLSGLSLTSAGFNHLKNGLGLYSIGLIALQGASTDFGTLSSSLTVAPAIPEPSTYALMGLGLVGIGFAARRRAAK